MHRLLNMCKTGKPADRTVHPIFSPQLKRKKNNGNKREQKCHRLFNFRYLELNWAVNIYVVVKDNKGNFGFFSIEGENIEVGCCMILSRSSRTCVTCRWNSKSNLKRFFLKKEKGHGTQWLKVACSVRVNIITCMNLILIRLQYCILSFAPCLAVFICLFIH